MAFPDSSKDRGVTQIACSRDQKWKAHCDQRSGQLAESYKQTQAEQLITEAVPPIQVPVGTRGLLSKLRSLVPNFRDLLIGS